MVNYLWPALTLLFAVVFNGVRSRWWIAPGMVLAFCGIVEILAGGQGFSLEGFISRLLEHPLSYILAVGAAVTWAAFSSMTRAWGGSTNLACLILHQRQHLRCAVALRLRHPNGGRTFGTRLDQRHPGRHCDGRRICCMDAGHDQREHHGAGSGFLFHAGSLVCFCSFWIGAKLDSSFWTGVAAVVVGSLLCWDATARGMKPLLALEAQGRTSAANRIWLHLTGRGSKR